jgi:hypothetical protein
VSEVPIGSHSHEDHQYDLELFRSYESAMAAMERGELPGFTSEDEFLKYAATRS